MIQFLIMIPLPSQKCANMSILAWFRSMNCQCFGSIGVPGVWTNPYHIVGLMSCWFYFLSHHIPILFPFFPIIFPTIFSH